LSVKDNKKSQVKSNCNQDRNRTQRYANYFESKEKICSNTNVDNFKIKSEYGVKKQQLMLETISKNQHNEKKSVIQFIERFE